MSDKKRQSLEDAKLNRKRAGDYIKMLRKRQGLTQAELAKAVGIEYFSFISAVETGANRVPPESVEIWAKALGQDRRDFAKMLLNFYDPAMFKAIFGVHKDL